MGAVVAHIVGRISRRGWPDRSAARCRCRRRARGCFQRADRGCHFVLEELVRRFDTRIAIAALGASATAILVARLFWTRNNRLCHNRNRPLAFAPAASWPFYLVLGVLAAPGCVLQPRLTRRDRVG